MNSLEKVGAGRRISRESSLWGGNWALFAVFLTQMQILILGA